MRRFLLSAVLLFAALVLQLTVLDRLPLPGGVAPDLVLLVVVALGLSGGPMAGMLGGFCAGLALDIAPPSGHLIGVYALVFCLVGYCCGMVSAELDRSVLLPLAASALGAAGGAALYAAVGVILGNPDVTGPAVRHVLPMSVLYDVLLSPFVLYGVALASRLSGKLAGAAASGESLAAQPAGLRPPARQGGRVPRLRPAAARPRDGWISGGGWLAASADLALARKHSRQPATVRLHLGGQRTAALPARTAGTGSVPRLRFGAGRRGDAVLGSRLPGSGFFSDLANSGRSLPGLGSGRRLFSRRGRTALARKPGAAWARFIRRPAWGYRGPGSAGSVPRRGSFSSAALRKGPGGAASPRRGTFRASTPRRRTLATGSPRRGAFRGGSSTRGSLGSGSPRRGAFGGGSRRFRALRRVSLNRATLRGGGAEARRRSALGRVRGGRTSAWRIGRKRSGGYR